jgi:hypothetical protein
VEIDYDLMKHAQTLTLMEYPLSKVKEILIRDGYPEEQVVELIDSTEETLEDLIPEKMKNAYLPVDKGYGYKTKLVKIFDSK